MLAQQSVVNRQTFFEPLRREEHGGEAANTLLALGIRRQDALELGLGSHWISSAIQCECMAVDEIEVFRCQLQTGCESAHRFRHAAQAVIGPAEQQLLARTLGLRFGKQPDH